MSGSQQRKLSNQCPTSSTGYFSVSTEIPANATLCKAFAIIYPCGGGSDTASPLISVSDPNNTAPPFDKDPLDPTLYVIKNMWYEEFSPNSNPVHFDTVYTDTFPEVIQPNSGCINIYETYLQARTFTNPPPINPLRVMWEPGYLAADTTSGYKWDRDTIVICGYVDNTDEWDDDVLLHEYGHFLMDYYAQLPPSGNIIYNWHQSLPSPSLRNLIYNEAWAYFFSSRARVGYTFDSLFVNTAFGIGSNYPPLWRNLENPWLGNDFNIAQFAGGPWCVGSVSGVLYDIYDSHNEIPYPSYPYPGFPDINLRDTLSLGINPIWDVFDHYDPPEKASNCWTIFHFRSGWNIYGYDHSFGFDQIFLHHRIRDTIPAKPTGLTASIENNNVRLYWHKNTELDLKGYRVYRRSIFPVVSRYWSIIAEKNSPTDTTHLDVTVQSSWTYQYKVTAFDSLGNESPFSDSVEIAIPLYPLNTDGATIITLPTIVDAKELEINFNNSCQDIVLEIYDCLGRIVNKQTVKLNNNNSLAIDLENKNHTQLSTGVYFLRLETNKNETIIKKFVIIK